jgi:hypothetical protein
MSTQQNLTNFDESPGEPTLRQQLGVSVSHLTDRLEGRNGGLRTSKPTTDRDDGLTQYIWRMARFHSGADPSMPVTASWWLQDYVDDLGIDASVSGVMDDRGEEITDELDKVTVEILEKLGLDPTAGARRWQKAGVID